MNQVVDLTNDNVPPVATIVKSRTLPPTVTGALVLNAQQNVMRNYQLPHQGQIPPVNHVPATARTLPIPLINRNLHLPLLNRPVPTSVQGGSLVSNLYRPPNATISFSLLNTREFVAKAEFGNISGEVIAMLKVVPGAKFDWAARRWVFPLDAHDVLQVSRSMYGDDYV